MNRRGFLSALALAPVAAVVTPAVKPAYAAGGYIKPEYGYLRGEAPGESILPLRAIVGHRGPELTSDMLPQFVFPVTKYGATDMDFLSLPPLESETREYVSQVATGTLRDLYLANSAV